MDSERIAMAVLSFALAQGLWPRGGARDHTLSGHSSDRRRTFTRSDDGFARFAVVRQRSRPCHAGLTRLGLEGSRRMLHRPQTGSCDKAFRACFP